MIQRNYIKTVAEDTKRAQRLSKDREKTYWLTQGGAWPQDPKDIYLMLNCVSARTGFSLETLEELRLHLQQLNNPWELRPLNRNEEPCPYKDTLDEDAMPTEPLDARQIQEDVENKHLRANPETTRVGGRKDQPTNSGASQPQNRGRSNPEGSAKFPNLPKGDGGKVRKGGDSTQPKAKVGASTKGRTTPPRQTQPQRSNHSPKAGPSGTRRPGSVSGGGTTNNNTTTKTN